jgi:hypothetical protein
MTIVARSLLPPDMDIALDAALVHGGVPEHLHDGLLRYLRFGVVPGSFLQAVLRNDLKDACFRAADPLTAAALRAIVLLLANYAAAESWGSEENYDAWVATGKESLQQQGDVLSESVSEQLQQEGTRRASGVLLP